MIDGGGEFDDLKAEWASKGIDVEIATADSQWRNGRNERTHGPIRDGLMTTLHESQLPRRIDVLRPLLEFEIPHCHNNAIIRDHGAPVTFNGGQITELRWWPGQPVKCLTA